MTKFEVRDWADNLLFEGKTFDTFEDGWAYVYEHVADEEDYQDIYVEEVN